jgi:thiol-disulfide isomerase/thioredoxin
MTLTFPCLIVNKLKSIIVILLLFFLFSCNQNDKEIRIIGNISNLPDGQMYLYKDISTNRIDSISTKNGEFLLVHKIKNNSKEPIYLGLDHVDRKGITRLISFPTSSKFKGAGFNSQYFLSDSEIFIKGLIKDFSPKSFSLDEKYILCVSPKISAGYQTNALFHIDGDLFDNINKTTYSKVLNKIKEYPISYHLLFQINNNRNSFTPLQVKTFLSYFKGEIVESETFKTLSEYNSKRIEKSKLFVPKLLDNSGKKVKILNGKYKKHLVIFWASWCGPCRQEIPALKTMYSKYKNDIEFVSISTDEKREAWQKALVKENMPWKQLILKENSKEYESVDIYFQLSSSIPYVALVDNNMKVLKSHVGLMNEKEIEKFIRE